MTPEARAFTDRFTKEIGRPPSFIQAGTYGAVLHYLKAVQAAGTDEAKAVMAEMKEMPINDFMTKNGSIREDGRVIRDMYLMQVKTPEESKSEWDLVKMVATVPGNEAFRPLNEGGCCPDRGAGQWQRHRMRRRGAGQPGRPTSPRTWVRAAVDKTYRAIADREDRAIGELSMGGYCGLNLGLRHRDTYSTITDLSGRRDRPTTTGCVRCSGTCPTSTRWLPTTRHARTPRACRGPRPCDSGSIAAPATARYCSRCSASPAPCAAAAST